MDDPTDAELIRRSFDEPAAFGAIFDRHAAALLGYANRRLGRAEAEDVLGEAFRIAFETRQRFDRSRPSALPWLYGIAANLIMKRHRSVFRGAGAVDRLRVVSDGRTDVPFDEAIAQHAANGELLAKVRVFMDELRPDDRETLVLYAWEGLGYDEIALALDVPAGTVKSRLNRIRRVLRELRDDCGEVMGVPSQRAPGGVV